jgi:tetratricopeptide (TPR) repeat protein
MNHRFLFVPALLFALLAAPAMSDDRISIDQVPMYGGMDRSAVPELKAGDAKLIEDTTKHYGSRQKASMAFVNAAFRYYQQDNLDFAMRRFNQAWLIDPDNPEVYWGFSSVLHDQGKYCEGLKLLELGLTKGSLQKGYMPDHATLYAACARHDAGLSAEQKAEYLRKSTEIFKAAEAESGVPKPYLYFQWARSCYALGQYAEAWDKVREYRKHTSAPFDEGLLAKLSEKMPEPK